MTQQGMSLSQEQRLQMVLAPQLRQSLELLQAPLLELRALIRAELEKNPTLEELPEAYTSLDEEGRSGADGETPSEPAEARELDFSKEFETLARLDEEWQTYFFQEERSQPYAAEEAERRQHFFDSLTQPETLQSHLLHQLQLAGLDDESRRIGEYLIGSLDNDGYLTASPEELAQAVNGDPARFRAVLEVIQDFDPVGVGARDLKECLLIQLDRLGKGNSLAAAIVRDYLEDLAAHRYAEMSRGLNVPESEIRTAAEFIATLNPRPGRAFSGDEPAYIAPDVFVRKVDDEYQVFLNDERVPHLRISRQYRELMQDPQTPPETKAYIQEKVRAGAFLIKSIQQRKQTLLNIAREIVRVQRDFFAHGVSLLKPLTMAQVAEVVGVHETTVSRAVSGKYMSTPAGLFEMKYFFTHAIKTADGGAVSNRAVMDMIAEMVAHESPEAPLSDQEIVDRLKAKGIDVARRTVAKYRTILKIPPSHQRKKAP